METKLIYMEAMQQLSCQANVARVDEQDGKTIVVLDQTVFYPQGGGQPYDTGTIISGTNTYRVSEVRYLDGEVLHIGTFEAGGFATGDSVECHVDADRRALHTRLHSAGHLVDFALRELGIDWKAGKGYHFPNGPYDEYLGTIADDKREETRLALEAKCNEIIGRDQVTEVRFMPLSEMAAVCLFVPESIPGGKPGRVVMYGEKGIACGGTHVAHLGEIGLMKIRKLKQEKEMVRVSYAIE